MPIIIAPSVRVKLSNKKPPITEHEVEQCFENRSGRLLFDQREDNKTDPPTQWFLERTNKNRVLKIVFVRNGADIHLKTAYDPNPEEIRIYLKYGIVV